MGVRSNLRRAVELIAHDMGAVNRHEPHTVDDTVFLLEQELKPEFLDDVERHLGTLSPPQLETACIGDSADREAMNLSPEVETALTMIFDAIVGTNEE